MPEPIDLLIVVLATAIVVGGAMALAYTVFSEIDEEGDYDDVDR